jgi:HK97 family phage major capsid protein
MAFKDLMAKRTALIGSQKAILDAAVAATRAITAEEKEKITIIGKEIADLNETISTVEATERNLALDLAVRSAGRGDVNPDTRQLDDVADKDISKYSILRAIRCILDKRPLDGLEREMSDEIARRSGKSPQGFFVPTRVLATRAILTPTTGTGAKLTAVSSDYIDLLRAQTVIASLGATFMGGLQGTFGIPKQTAGSSAYWIDAVGGTVTLGSPTIGQVVLSPKTIGAMTDLSRGFISQTSIDAEQFARNDIIKNLAVGIDTAAVNGSGTSNQPLGVRNNTNCQEYSLSSLANVTAAATMNATASGSAMTYAAVVQLETNVAANNVAIDSGAYLFTPASKGKLKTTPKVSGYPEYIYEMDEVNGYRAVASNILPNTNGTNNSCSTAIFGNWKDLMVGEWGTLDLTVDPYSLSNAGSIRLVGLQDVDIQLRRNESFSKILDHLTS